MNLTEIKQALELIVTDKIQGLVVTITVGETKHEMTLSEFSSVIDRAIASQRLKQLIKECSTENKLKMLEPPF